MRLVTIATLTVVTLLSTGCVTKQTHEAALQELNKTRDSLGSAQKTIHDQQLQIESNEKEIARSKELIELNNVELSDLDLKKAVLQRELDEAQKLLNTAESQLQASRSRLSDSEAQLETMRQIEAETKKRNEIYARFVTELQKMIDGGQLTVSIEQGRIVINLPDNVLFATGSARVNADGQVALKQIANVLKEFSDRRFQIEGHTDNVPMKSARFPSNWELSTARALSVVHLMIQEGVAAENVSAAGFGEFHPRADNESKEGRALNRRIEIIMQPNLEILSNELPKVAE
ncbi:OmpA family protein [Sulfurimonas sp. HSL3-7]|uniref:OmpA/MotB family protein n=1 Tax=Sulfonitrofixus jiaomeiensis TaxID=3131938 RepID=UPI0031F72C5A